MSGLEHLVIVLLFDVHPLIYCLFLHVLLLEAVWIGRVEGHAPVRVLHLLLSDHLLSKWTQHVGDIFTLGDLDYLQLFLFEIGVVLEGTIVFISW